MTCGKCKGADIVHSSYAEKDLWETRFGSGRGLRSKMGDEDRMVIGKISEIRWGPS